MSTTANKPTAAFVGASWLALMAGAGAYLFGLWNTGLYAGLCWLSMAITITLMGVGLYNARLALSEKGFYGMAFLLALFATIAIQKNVRDSATH